MGGKSSTSSQQVTIPPEVLARYNAVNANAEQVAQTPYQQYSSDPNAFVAPLTAAQNQGLQQTADYANSAQPGLAAAEGMTLAGTGAANPQALTSQYINQYMNPYQQDVVQQESQLLNQQYQTAQSGQLGNAIQSGAFGGDRAGIAAANLQQQQSLAYGNTMAGILQGGYNTALSTAQQQQGVDLSAQQANLQRLQSGASQLGTLAQAGQSAGLAGAQAMMSAGQVQQQTQQAGLTALYNQFLQQQSYPFQTAQFLANIAEGTGALSGQTTTTTQPSSFFSDRRLKEDIKEIGKAKNGLPIYSFRYKNDPDKLTRIGFMADEVEKKHPEAIGLAGGYKTVDYERAARASGGGLVTDFDHGAAFARGGLDSGGVAYPDWSGVTQAEAAMYGQNAGAGVSTDGSPYGGKARVPQSQQTQHHMLQPGQAPKPQQNGMQQAMQGIGQLEKLGSMAKGAQGLAGKIPGLGGSNDNAAKPQAAAPPSDSSSSTTPPSAGAPPPADVPTPPPRPDDLASAADSSSGLSAGDAAVMADAGDGGGLLSGLGDLFAAHGGRIGREAGGSLPSTGVSSPQLYDAVARQNALPTWNGPFARGGLARGHFDTGGAPVVTGAPTHGPDVVSPTQAYLTGLGEAQDAQKRANDLQDQQRAEMARLGISTSPDLTPAGQFYDNLALNQSMMAQGMQGIYSPSYSGSMFARGGLAGRGHFGVGGSPDTDAWDSADHEYQAGDDNSTQNTTRMGIPDEKPNVEPLKPSNPPSQGSGGGMGGISQGIGALTGLLGLFLNTGGAATRRRGLAAGGDPDDPTGGATLDLPDPTGGASLDLPDPAGGAVLDLPRDGGLKPAEVTHANPTGGATLDAPKPNPTGGAALDLPIETKTPPSGLAGADDVLARRRAAGDTSEELGPSPALAKMAPQAGLASADIPTPPERPAELGGPEAPEPSATPAASTSDNPIVRAGNAVSGAITHGVEGAAGAVQRTAADLQQHFRDMAMPRNARNNNPGNIEDGPFARSQPGYAGSDGRFARFDSPEAGSNAFGALAARYGSQGRVTPMSFIAKWAPPNENDTAGYAASVARKLGIGVNDRMDLNDPQTLKVLHDAVTAVEGGPRALKYFSGGPNTGGAMPDDSNIVDRAGSLTRDFQANAAGGESDDNGSPFDQAGRAVAKAGQGAGDWFGQNRSWMIPLLSGLGGMASSNSRYLGSAILQGMGTGAQAYANEQMNEAKLAQQQQETGLTREQTEGQKAKNVALQSENPNRAYFSNNGIPMVHAIDENGRPVDMNYGDFLRRQRANPNVRPQTTQEMSRAGSAGIGPARVAPVVNPAPYGSPNTTAPAMSSAPGSDAPPAGVGGVTPHYAAPAPRPAPAQPAAAPQGGGAPHEISPGVNYSSSAHAAANSENIYDPTAKIDAGQSKAVIAGIRNEGQNEARNAPLLHDQMKNTSAMASESGPGTPGAGSEWRYRVINGLNTAARAANYQGPLLSGNDTREQLADKYRALQSFAMTSGAGQTSNASLVSAMGALPNLSMSPDAMAEVQAQLMLQSQYKRDYANFAEQWLRDNPNATFEHLQDEFTKANPPAKYTQEKNALAGIIRSKPGLISSILDRGMKQPEVEQAMQQRMHLQPGLSRYFF